MKQPRSGSFSVKVSSSPAELHAYYSNLLQEQGYTIREIKPRPGIEDLAYWLDAQNSKLERTLSIRIFKENPLVSAETVYWESLFPGPFSNDPQAGSEAPHSNPSPADPR